MCTCIAANRLIFKPAELFTVRVFLLCVISTQIREKYGGKHNSDDTGRKDVISCVLWENVGKAPYSSMFSYKHATS